MVRSILADDLREQKQSEQPLFREGTGHFQNRLGIIPIQGVGFVPEPFSSQDPAAKARQVSLIRSFHTSPGSQWSVRLPFFEDSEKDPPIKKLGSGVLALFPSARIDRWILFEKRHLLQPKLNTDLFFCSQTCSKVESQDSNLGLDLCHTAQHFCNTQMLYFRAKASCSHGNHFHGIYRCVYFVGFIPPAPQNVWSGCQIRS